MKIATWNVNSVRTRKEQILKWLGDSKLDLLCLQETKVDDPLFPDEPFREQGYEVSFHGQKAYNGVALISLHPIQDVRVGFQGELHEDKQAQELDAQKRVISALINGVRVVNLYVPNGASLRSEKYEYKLNWLDCLAKYLKAQAKREEPLCVLGDFNIALEARDLHNPKKHEGTTIMASDAERLALKKALGKNLTDVFRIFEPNANHWSWWDYRSGAWDRDEGWRIDQIYLSQELLELSRSCFIEKKLRGNEQPSDHAPVIVDINWPAMQEDLETDSELFFN